MFCKVHIVNIKKYFQVCIKVQIWVRSLGWEDPLEEGTATHPSILAWKIPWAQSMESKRVGHEGATCTSLHRDRCSFISSKEFYI